MPDTYSQIFLHFIFAVKDPEELIREDIRERVEQYMTRLIQGKKCRLMAIYCMPDHVHLLVQLHPTIAPALLVQVLKVETTNFINENRLTDNHFYWQHAYGCFSHSREELKRILAFIREQPQHHSAKNFREEYLELLTFYHIDYQDEYLFDFFE